MNTNTSNLLQQVVCCFLFLTFASCTDTDLQVVEETGIHTGKLWAIQEVGSQTISFNLKYDVPDGYRVAFEVYSENPLDLSGGVPVKKEALSPVLTGITNGRGAYKLSRVVSEQVKEVYIYSTYIGVPVLLYGKIENGTVSPCEIDLTQKEADTKSAMTRAATTFPFVTLGSWNSLGKPDYISKKENVSSSLLWAINCAFPEWKAAKPDYTKRTDIYVKEAAQIWVSMLHSGSLFDNVLGYFCYQGDINKVDPNSIHEIIAFPRANIIRLFSSGLKAGEAVQLKYYDPEKKEYKDTFPTGVSIGWVVRTSGYSLLRRSVGDGHYRFYSYPDWNPEKENRNHTVLFKKDNFVVVGFEDMPNERLEVLKGDGDCNDLMFHVSSYPTGAITYDIPEVPDGNDDIEDTEEVDCIQPLCDILDIPAGDPFWSDLFVASKSMLYRTAASDSDPDSYGMITGVRDELVIANSKTMESLIVDQETSSYRAFVKTTIRKIDTKADPPKRKFVKTTVRGVTVYIEMDDLSPYANSFAYPQGVAASLYQKIESVKELLQNNIPVRIIIEMNFDPVPEDEFVETLPIGPYSLFIGDSDQ